MSDIIMHASLLPYLTEHKNHMITKFAMLLQYKSIEDCASIKNWSSNCECAPMMENEYDILNRDTMQECSSEYQLLRADTMSTIRHRYMARNLGAQKQRDDCNSAQVAMKKILVTMVVINIMLVLLITVIAIAIAVFSYSRPTAGEISNDVNSLGTEMNQLAATFQTNISHILMQLDVTSAEIATTIQTNLSHVLFQLDALNRDVLLVQHKSASQQIQLYCGAGDWRPIISINMSDPSQQCPSAWREFNGSGIRGCGRQPANEGTCSANSYSAGNQYSRVCGRLIGYQVGSPDGFIGSQTIDEIYMNGVSITHGTSPRSHIWSYVAGVTERSPYHQGNNCPCSPEAGTGPQPFVGDDYYCESGNPSDEFVPNKLYDNDPLWDGQQCEGTCCTGTNSPPWFSVQLPAPTTDMIEVRICGDESTNNEDTLIEVLDIFVK